MAVDFDPQKAYAQIIAKAWSDEAFKERLLKEPVSVLKEHGAPLPDGVDIRIVENTADVVHVVLPPKPDDELNEEQLEQVTGGYCAGCGCATNACIGCCTADFGEK